MIEIEIKDDIIIAKTSNKEYISKFFEIESLVDEIFAISPTEYRFKISKALLNRDDFSWFVDILRDNGKNEIFESVTLNNALINEVIELSKKERDIEYFKSRHDWDEFSSSILNRMKNISITGEHSEITIKQLIRVYIYSRLKNFANFSEPGTGKTITTLMTFINKENELNDELRLIVICPISAIDVWYDEITNFTKISDEEIHIYREDYKKQNKNELSHDTLNAKVIIVNYESVKSFLKNGANKTTYYNKKNFIVYDEVHRIKSGGSHYSESFKLSNWGDSRVILTGTPYSKEINEIKNIFKLNWSGTLPTITEKEFEEYNQRIKVNHDDGIDGEATKSIRDDLSPYYFKLSKEFDFGMENAIDNYKTPIMVSADKSQVIIDNYFRDKIASIVSMIENETNMKRKEELKKSLDANYAFAQINSVSPTILAKNNRELLERISGLDIESIPTFENLPKIKEALKFIKAKVQRGEKVIVWMRYKSNLENFHELLNENSIKSTYINGDVEPNTRSSRIAKFNNSDNDQVMVLIATPSTLAESISLHKHVHNSLFIERGFSYYQWIQAKDRIHRVGIPEGVVTIHDYIKSNELWIDRKIAENLELKHEINNKIFGSLVIDDDFADQDDDHILWSGTDTSEIGNSEYNLNSEDLDKNKSFDSYDEYLNW